MYFHGSNQREVTFGWDYAAALNMRQAIILTNDGLIYWHIYASLSFDEFKSFNDGLMLYMLYMRS